MSPNRSLLATAGHHRCGRHSVCPQTLETDKVVFPELNLEIDLKHFSNCASKRVIYLIKRPCPKYYIAMSTRAIRTRIIEHKSRIHQQHLDLPLVPHFVENDHADKYNKVDVQKMLLRWEAF